MDKFLYILAWILVIPTSLYVGWVMTLIVLAFCIEEAKLTITRSAFILFIIFALSWAWILSR